MAFALASLHGGNLAIRASFKRILAIQIHFLVPNETLLIPLFPFTMAVFLGIMARSQLSVFVNDDF